MMLCKGKISTKIIALLLAIILCISPYTISRAYAAASSDTSTQAVLSKGIFGVLKKANNTYYVIDEYGNIINGVVSPNGSNLDRYIGRQILVKDNIFAGLDESQQRKSNTFLSRLREYFSGIVPRPKPVVPKPIDPIDKPKPIEDPIMQPMYGVYIPDPIFTPIDKPKDIDPIVDPGMHLMYGVFPYPGGDDKFIPGDGDKEPIVDPGMHLMYGVFPIDRVIEEPLKEELPLRGKPTIAPTAEQIAEQSDKMNVIQKQGADRAELTKKGIQIVPEIEQKKDILDQKKE